MSNAHEKEVAKKLGAKRHKGSGSGTRTQDMHTGASLIECKTVLEGTTQITIKRSVLRQLKRNAAVEGVKPVLCIRLDDEDWLLTRIADLD